MTYTQIFQDLFKALFDIVFRSPLFSAVIFSLLILFLSTINVIASFAFFPKYKLLGFADLFLTILLVSFSFTMPLTFFMFILLTIVNGSYLFQFYFKNKKQKKW